MRAAFITVGDTSRLTGGYLYHQRVFERLGEYGIEVEEVVPSGASVGEQKSGASRLADFDPRGFDVVVVDMLARVVAAPFVEEWRKERPVVAMVHELPSVAAPEGDVEGERGFEKSLLEANFLIAVSKHGKSLLENRGVPANHIHIVSPGFDGIAPEVPHPGSESRDDDIREIGSVRGDEDFWEVFRRDSSRVETFPSAEKASDRNIFANEGSRNLDPARRDGSETENMARMDAENQCRAGRVDTENRRRPTPHPLGHGLDSGVPADSETLRAICVAQWIPRKGILDLVEAWRMADIPNAVLELVGETDADPEYRSRVMAEIGGETSILVSGTLDEAALFAAYSDADFFVLPSRFEGYGIVFAEALSFGLPVVARDVEPVPEVVGVEAGVFVEPGNIEELSHAIHKLLSDKKLRCRMSEAALRRSAELPRWDDTARGFAEVLWEAVERV